MFRKEQLKIIFARAQENYLGNEYEESLLLLNEVLALDKSFAEGHELRAKILIKMNKQFDALSSVREWLNLEPTNAAAHHLCAAICLKIELEKDAVTSLLEAIRLSPDNALYYFDLGEAYSALGEKEKAKPCFQKALEIDRAMSKSYVESGLVLMKQEAYQEAIDIFSKGLSLVPNHPELHRFRADAHCARQDYEAAIADYTVLINDDVADSGLFLARGHAYVGRGDVGLAIWDFVRAHEATDQFEAKAIAGRALHTLLMPLTGNEVLMHIKRMTAEDKRAQLLEMCLNQKESFLAKKLQERKISIDDPVLAEVKGVLDSPRRSPRGSPRSSSVSIFKKSGGMKREDLRASGEKLKAPM